MPRPRPLTNVAPGHYDPDQQLTPRTPHSGSRTSRAEQGFAKLQVVEEANDAEDDGGDTFQSAPLLASSSSARFSRRNIQQPPKFNGRKILDRSAVILSTAISRLPLVAGIFTAGILLFLTVLSFTRREALHKYVGAKAPNITVSTSGSKAGHLLSYENYTTFPLYPFQYLAECKKINTGYMRHGDYWDISLTGVIDTAHHDPSATGGNTRVCSSSITYMLDGTVGLTADLALMAQAAALAREVGIQSSTIFHLQKLNSSSKTEHSLSTTPIGIAESMQRSSTTLSLFYFILFRWTDHFEDVRTLQPGPEPNCVPPPANGQFIYLEIIFWN